jgi:transketolase
VTLSWFDRFSSKPKHNSHVVVLFQKCRPYCGTFLVFAGYCVGGIRLSALSRFGIIYVFTHDSIGLGEDGPTHQPVETLESLRAIPNLYVYRPADLNEMSGAYKVALESRETPTVICCSRSNTPALKNSTAEKAAKGAYACIEVADPALILVASGSEVEPCLAAAEALTKDGIATRVVSMPCQEVFLKQSETYQKEVLPGNIPTMSVEASVVSGWHRFSHAQIGMPGFGASGSGADVFTKFGFTAENVTNKGKELVEFYKGKSVPDLTLRPNFTVSNGHGH